MTAKKLLLLLLAVGVSADYWTDRGYTYEVYKFDLPAKPQNVYQQQQPQQQYYYPQQQQQYYPQQQQQHYYPQQQQQNHHHQKQKHQQQQYYPQIQVTQQTNPSVSVSEAEWVCTNTKTQDMMIIASEDGPVPNRVNGQQQWHQVYPQQPGSNQPNYPQPQQPVYPQTQAPPVTSALTTTTEDTNRPIWGGGGYDNRYPQTQAPVTIKPTTTTTEDTNRPIWGDNNKQTNFPEVKPSFPTSTTQKPVDPLWPDGGSGNKPGFTVIEPTRKPKPHKTTKASIDDDDDDGPLEIVMG